MRALLFICAFVYLFLPKSAISHRAYFDRVEELSLNGKKAVLEVIEYVFSYEGVLYDRVRLLMDVNRDRKIAQDEADRYANARALSILSAIKVSIGSRGIRFRHTSSRADKFPPDLLRNYTIRLWHRFEGSVQGAKCAPLSFTDMGEFKRAVFRVKWENFCSVREKGKFVERGALEKILEGKDRTFNLNFTED